MEQTTLKFAPEPNSRLDNDSLGEHLEAIADALEAARADVFRVRAFRAAAHTLRETPVPVRGMERTELEELAGVGPRIASVLLDHIESRSGGMLERLHSEVGVEDHLMLIDGVGPALAVRLQEQLGVDSLQALHRRASELETVDGVGAKSAARMRASLEELLARRRQSPRAHRRPPVKLLLEIDARYRRLAAADELPRIAPRRNNPSGHAWLPVWRGEVDGWSARALFSNTDSAHAQGRTDDWVVIYLEREGVEDRATIVTETRGVLEGRRVVRGREGESRRFHLDSRVTRAA